MILNDLKIMQSNVKIPQNASSEAANRSVCSSTSHCSLRLHLAQKSPWQQPDQVPHLSQRSKVQRLDGYYFFRICLFQKVTQNAASEAASRSVCSVHLTEATLGSEIPMATA